MTTPSAPAPPLKPTISSCCGSFPPSTLASAYDWTAASAHGSSWQILLQKSFSTADQNFSRPLVRFSYKYVRDLISS
jgi:hypothetical protein